MTEASAESGTWYWCLRHKAVEDGDTSCPPDDRMGPYGSREAAEHWREKKDARNESWDKEDEEWSGEAV
jgi:hypothetical protein